MIPDIKCAVSEDRQQANLGRHLNFQSGNITVNISKTRQLFARFLAKTNPTLINQQRLIQLLNQSKVEIQENNKNKVSKQLFSREKQLMRELSNLNKIKQNNQRILKNKIKQIQQKLWKNDQKQFNQSKKVQLEIELGILKLDLYNKNNDIQQFKKLIIDFENKIQGLEEAENQLSKQKQHLVRIIYETIQYFQQFLKQMEDQTMNSVQVKKESTYTQTIQKYRDLTTLSINKILNQKIQLKNLNKKQQLDLYTNNQELMVLQKSNSELRRQLIQLHQYLEEKEEKYAKNIQVLEDKIKKLTYFNKYNSRRTSISNLSQSTGFFTPRKMFSIDQSQIIRPDISQTIKLADLQIELELSKEGQQFAERINLIRETKLEEQHTRH